MVPDSQNCEVEQVAGELRASIRRAQVPRSRSGEARITISSATFEPDGAMDPDLAVMHSTYDIASAPFTSHRKVLGRLIIFIKNLARELLVQLLARQSAYNGAAVRVIGHRTHKLGSLEAEHARMAQRLAALEARLAAAESSGVSDGRVSTVSLRPGTLNERPDAAEKAGAEQHRGPRCGA